MFRLTLLLPGLLGSITGLPGDEKPKYPAIEMLLTRAGIRRTPRCSFYRDLCRLMALDKAAGADLPVAPLARLIDGAEHPDGVWMRADPVHLAAGRNGVRLTDASSLGLSQHDAINFAATLESLFNENDWKLEVPLPYRWYVRLPRNPAITTSEIDSVTGKDIQPYLPAGADSNEWLRLMNEVQMLLHGCEMNREREQRGALAINSLWFWGIGVLPEILPRQWSRIYSDDPVAQGLAMLSGTEFMELPDDLSELSTGFEDGGDVLLACASALSGSKYQDMNVWLAALERTEQHWFQPILDAIQLKSIDEVTLITGGYEFTVNRYSFLRFWRRQKSIIDYA